MIDFRYHLVSLISVFLALAVGIVLGAGPLRENLGDQLAGQVEQLRTEQEQLRSEAEELAVRNDQLATFISEAGPQLVEGTLDGTDVVVISDAETTRDAVDRMTALLTDAGAGSVTTVQLRSALWEPEQVEARAAALQQIEQHAPELLPEDPADELTDAARIAAVVPALLRTDGEPQLSTDARGEIWQLLLDEELIGVDGDVPDQVGGVIVASGAPGDLVDPNEDGPDTAERSQSLLSAQTALVDALADSGMPAVVSAVTPDNDASTGILRTVRGDDAGKVLSTTDRLQEVDGPLLAVLALVEQQRGGAGAYGTTSDAQRRLPDLPETGGVDPEQDAAPSDGGGEG